VEGGGADVVSTDRLQLLESTASEEEPAGQGEHTRGWPFQYEPVGHVRGPEEMPIEGLVSVDV
jgi:hypothetical protein